MEAQQCFLVWWVEVDNSGHINSNLGDDAWCFREARQKRRHENPYRTKIQENKQVKYMD